jgi:hypothetical protein
MGLFHSFFLKNFLVVSTTNNRKKVQWNEMVLREVRKLSWMVEIVNGGYCFGQLREERP